jgi:polyisoprenoid-binding protein YceI
MLRYGVLILLIVDVGIARAGAGDSRTYTIETDRSRAAITVGKSGLLSFAAGHTHEVTAPSIAGHITLDPADPGHSTVHVAIDSATLSVSAVGEPPDDVPKIQQTMTSEQVLDVRRYPTIAFDSTGVSVKHSGIATLDVIVAGRLTLHNVTRDVSVPVSVHINGDELTATGRFSVKQTDYGITPVSVAGVVSVKDALDISFTIVSR